MIEELNKICKEEFNKFFPKTRIKYIRKKYHSPKGRFKACKKDIEKIIFNVVSQYTSLFLDIPKDNFVNMGDVREFPISSSVKKMVNTMNLFIHIDKAIDNDKVAIGNQVYSIKLGSK